MQRLTTLLAFTAVTLGSACAVPSFCRANTDCPEGVCALGVCRANSPPPSADAGAPDGPDGGLVLARTMGCPRSLFADVAVEEDFTDAGTYAAQWTPSFVSPALQGGQLVFPAQPVSANWWDMFGQTATHSAFSDALICVRFRATPSASRETGFEVSLRGPDVGKLTVSWSGLQHAVTLYTKLASGKLDAFERQPLTLENGSEYSVETVLWLQGQQARAELRVEETGQGVILDSAVPSVGDGGVATLVGWQLESAVVVERVVIGQPTAQTVTALAQH